MLQPIPAQSRARRLLNAWLDLKSANTRSEYHADIRHFANFAGHAGVEHAIEELLAAPRLLLTELLNGYRRNMIDRELAGATINRRIAGVRSLLSFAHRLGEIDHLPYVPSVEEVRVRDTAGPGLDACKRMLAAAAGKPRDYAILSLLVIHGLRRNEVGTLRRKDYDGRALLVKRKGRHDRERVVLSVSTKGALDAWCTTPLDLDGPLFPCLKRGGSLGGVGVYKLVKKYGKIAGVSTAPHAIRHTSITTACIEAGSAGVPIEQVMAHSGHRSLDVLLRYRDGLADKQEQIAQMVDDALRR